MDLQLGVIRGPNAGRWLVPDFGIDVGLTRNVELGADGSFALEGTPEMLYAFHHSTADNVWLSSKVGLFDSANLGTRTAWAGGFQVGPKLAAAPRTRGAGFEGLLLLGRTIGKTHLVANLGGFVDPGAEISRRRPIGIETGVDVEIGLRDGKTWRILADLSAVYFPSGQPTQLQTTFGPQVSLTEWLDLAPQALVGVLPGADRFGGLLVLSPRIRALH
jgi:hypothetical protein